MSQKLKPARVASPGEILRHELAARGWTQKYLAEITGQSPNLVSKIVRGLQPLNSELASTLATAFGTSTEVWLNLEANYRAFLLEKEKSAATPEIYDAVV